MPKISYVNGQYLPLSQATVNIEDRGFQLADGVYEVIAIFNRHLVDKADHLRRLARSLNELRISLPVNISALNFIMSETIRKNRVVNGNTMFLI